MRGGTYDVGIAIAVDVENEIGEILGCVTVILDGSKAMLDPVWPLVPVFPETISGCPSRLMSAMAQVSKAPGSIMWRANGISAGRVAAHASTAAIGTAQTAARLSLLISPIRSSDSKDNLKKPVCKSFFPCAAARRCRACRQKFISV